jgi:hypothetical protein
MPARGAELVCSPVSTLSDLATAILIQSVAIGASSLASFTRQLIADERSNSRDARRVNIIIIISTLAAGSPLRALFSLRDKIKTHKPMNDVRVWLIVKNCINALCGQADYMQGD